MGSKNTAKTDGNPIVRLLSMYCRRYIPHLSIAVVSTFLARLLWFYPPIVVGTLFDAILIGDSSYDLPGIPGNLVPSGQMDQFWFSVAVILGTYLFGYAAFLVGSWLRSIAAYRVQHDLRTDAYRHTQRLGYEFFQSREKGDLISILNNDVNQMETFLNNTLNLISNTVFITVVIAVYMLILNWQLALVAFAVPVLIAVSNFAYSRYVEPRYQEMRSSVGDISSRIENNISGIDVIKTYTREEFEANRITDLSREYRDVSWTIARARIALDQITDQLSNLGYVLVLVVGGLWVLSGPSFTVFDGDLAAASLLAFLLYNERLAWPLAQITTIVDRYQEAKAAGRRVFRLLDREPTVRDTGEQIDVDIDNPSLAFSAVSFRYDGENEYALSDIDLPVDSGETVGIVGPTGAGKSTLLRLIFRFYDPDTGAVEVDGTDIRNIEIEAYRNSIGYVSQDPYLFDGTVAENIAYGGDDPSHTDVIAAAKSASAHDFVTELDAGYETTVGEGGSRLSGGQKQRIAIARAIVGDPEILVLDEATSHVDNATEVVLQQNLDEITADRTTFIVAHNLAGVRDADEILVMEDGTITQAGTHEQLLESGGLYSDLWYIQTGEFDKVSDIERVAGRRLEHAAADD